jgi:hypothetical protein
MIRILTKPYNKWDRQTKRCLISMTFRGESGMREQLSYVPDSKTWVAFLHDRPVGWAIYDDFHDSVQLYVKRSCRCNGIGKKLLAKATKYEPRCRVHCHDGLSGYLFESANIDQERIKWC